MTDPAPITEMVTATIADARQLSLALTQMLDNSEGEPLSFSRPRLIKIRTSLEQNATLLENIYTQNQEYLARIQELLEAQPQGV